MATSNEFGDSSKKKSTRIKTDIEQDLLQELNQEDITALQQFQKFISTNPKNDTEIAFLKDLNNAIDLSKGFSELPDSQLTSYINIFKKYYHQETESKKILDRIEEIEDSRKTMEAFITQLHQDITAKANASTAGVDLKAKDDKNDNANKVSAANLTAASQPATAKTTPSNPAATTSDTASIPVANTDTVPKVAASTSSTNPSIVQPTTAGTQVAQAEASSPPSSSATVSQVNVPSPPTPPSPPPATAGASPTTKSDPVTPVTPTSATSNAATSASPTPANSPATASKAAPTPAKPSDLTSAAVDSPAASPKLLVPDGQPPNVQPTKGQAAAAVTAPFSGPSAMPDTGSTQPTAAKKNLDAKNKDETAGISLASARDHRSSSTQPDSKQVKDLREYETQLSKEKVYLEDLISRIPNFDPSGKDADERFKELLKQGEEGILRVEKLIKSADTSGLLTSHGHPLFSQKRLDDAKQINQTINDLKNIIRMNKKILLQSQAQAQPQTQPTSGALDPSSGLSQRGHQLQRDFNDSARGYDQPQQSVPQYAFNQQRARAKAPLESSSVPEPTFAKITDFISQQGLATKNQPVSKDQCLLGDPPSAIMKNQERFSISALPTKKSSQALLLIGGAGHAAIQKAPELSPFHMQGSYEEQLVVGTELDRLNKMNPQGVQAHIKYSDSELQKLTSDANSNPNAKKLLELYHSLQPPAPQMVQPDQHGGDEPDPNDGAKRRGF